MSTSYTIHVRPASDATAEDLLADLAAALGAELFANEYGDGWSVQTPAGIADMFTEQPRFDDEPGIPFSQYPWYVEMGTPKVDDARNRQVLAQLWSLYEALTVTGRYLCCFVHEFSTLLATNDPAVTREPEHQPFLNSDQERP